MLPEDVRAIIIDAHQEDWSRISAAIESSGKMLDAFAQTIAKEISKPYLKVRRLVGILDDLERAKRYGQETSELEQAFEKLCNSL